MQLFGLGDPTTKKDHFKIQERHALKAKAGLTRAHQAFGYGIKCGVELCGASIVTVLFNFVNKIFFVSSFVLGYS